MDGMGRACRLIKRVLEGSLTLLSSRMVRAIYVCLALSCFVFCFFTKFTDVMLVWDCGYRQMQTLDAKKALKSTYSEAKKKAESLSILRVYLMWRSKNNLDIRTPWNNLNTTSDKIQNNQVKMLCCISVSVFSRLCYHL